MDEIHIRGARTHNLANIDLDLPRDRLSVITGLSGSGKSSLAFDTIFAEGQRRYVESLSAYARQFLTRVEKPDVDSIEGLSPAISIEQKSASHNPRSTVGTITEIHDYLRLMYARAGTPRCPTHGHSLQAQTVSEMVDHVRALPEGQQLLIVAPVVRNRKGEHQELLRSLLTQGFLRARIDGAVRELDEPIKLDLRRKHNIDVVVDRVKVRSGIRSRLAESFETALRLGHGVACVASADGSAIDATFSSQYACPECGYSLDELEPRLFSFNSPIGACPQCDGLGTQTFFDEAKIVQPGLSLEAGAIRSWDKRNTAYFDMLKTLAKHYKFSLDVPYKALPERAKNVLMHGSGEDMLDFHYRNHSGRRFRSRHAFEGVLSTMKRRFRDTQSSAVREELSRYLSDSNCPSCDGERLNLAARHVFIASMSLPQLQRQSIADALKFFDNLELEGHRGKVAEKVIAETRQRLHFLVNVGLDYLSLERRAETLSGGEAQRIRLASQVGSGLVGVTYILDEPSIGLHQRDNNRLLNTLAHLRDIGNTVIVVEHDEQAMRHADHLVDIGPGAGVHGGRIIAQGTLNDIIQNQESLTGQYLSGARQIEIPKQRRPMVKKQCLTVRKACNNNLRNLDVSFPLGLLTCVTGVSGSGKSTLINDTLYAQIAQPRGWQEDACDLIEGTDLIDKIIRIDQSPIGRTPRSNPATYTGLFGPVRELFSETQEARARGYKPGRFSFNVRGGRCEACDGDGVIRVEMHFLPDIYVPCDVCAGLRYNRETLDVQYKGKNIADVLDMTVETAHAFFEQIPAIRRKLDTLMQVGLSYIRLGQNATTLSGGEAQRVKLSRELSRRGTGQTLYILDEPTTGLHFQDIQMLLQVLHRLRDRGNTVIVIEHNLDVIKTADWVIDLGPEGGAGGGRVVAQGTPEQVARSKRSYTGQFLKEILQS